MSLQIPNWLNAHFMQNVLKKSESDDSIKVKAITIKPATQNGDNYMSLLLRVGVEYTCNKSDCTDPIRSDPIVVKNRSLILKIAPGVEDCIYQIVTGGGAFETEINMMTNTLVKMREVLNEKDYILNACALYTETGDPTLLVIDDLAAMDYRMADRLAGLDLQHCMLVIRRLAKFHASSVAVCEKEPKQKLYYTRSFYDLSKPQAWKQFIPAGVRALSSEVSNWLELGSSAKKYSEKIFKLIDVCYQKASEISKAKDGEFQVLNHGDCWTNNMLFRYNREGNVIDQIFVDFQGSFWSSPAIDILQFINTSLSLDIYENHRPALIEEYLKCLTETMLKIGCKTKPPSMTDLQKSLDERAFLEVVLSFVHLAFALIDKSEALDLEDLFNEGAVFVNPAYKGPIYRKMLLRRLDDWNARGLLDV